METPTVDESLEVPECNAQDLHFAELGKMLADERKARGMTCQEIADGTHMGVSFIRKLEAGGLDNAFASAQALYYHSYARFLGIPAERVTSHIPPSEPFHVEKDFCIDQIAHSGDKKPTFSIPENLAATTRTNEFRERIESLWRYRLAFVAILLLLIFLVFGFLHIKRQWARIFPPESAKPAAVSVETLAPASSAEEAAFRAVGE